MTGFDDRFAQLRARFVTRMREDHASLIAARQEGDLATMRRIAHGLAGNGGIFGFPEVGEAAHALETALDKMGTGPPPDHFCRTLEEQLAQPDGA